MNSTTFFYSYNNQFRLKISASQLTIAAKWLRSQGCIFNSLRDQRKSSMHTIIFKFIPGTVAAKLQAKHGIKQTVVTQPAPAAKSTAPKKWFATKADFEAYKALSSDPWTSDVAVTSKRLPSAGFYYQLCLPPATELKSAFHHTAEQFKHRTRKADPVSPNPAEFYNPVLREINRTTKAADGNLTDDAAAAQQSLVDNLPKQPLSKLTVPQLKAQCIFYGIAFKSKARKPQLISLLKANGIMEA